MTHRSYGEWIARNIFATRAPADPGSLPRSLRLLTASAARILNQKSRRKIAERIASLPLFKQAAQDDDAVNRALGLTFVPVRLLGDLTFSLRDYTDAIRLAERGRASSVIDTNGVAHDLRSMCRLDGQAAGFGFFQGGVLEAFDADWRTRLPDASDDETRRLVNENRLALELATGEVEAFASRVINADPLNRVRVIDDRFDHLANVFLLRMRTALNEGEGIRTQDVMPLRPTGLAEYVCLELSDDVDLERITERMLSRMPAVEAFERLAGLPGTLPDSLLRAVESEIKSPLQFVHALLRASGTPVSMFHSLRLAVRLLPVKVAARLAERVVRVAINAMSGGQFQQYMVAVQWFADELWRRPESQRWSAPKRGIVAWVYAHQIVRLLRDSGYGIQEAATVLTSEEGCEEGFFGSRVAIVAPYNPRLVGPAELLVCGLADALQETPDLISDASQERLSAALRVDYDPMPWIPSIFNACDGSQDDMGSYFAGNRVAKIRGLIRERFTEHDARWFGQEKLVEACGDAVAGAGVPWAYIAARLHTSTPGPEIANMLLADVSAMSAADALLRESSIDWCLRLTTLARVVTLNGNIDHIDAMWKIWTASVALIAAVPSSATNENAMALIQAASSLAKTESDYRSCITLFCSRLRILAEASPPLVDIAGLVARRLISRLPADFIAEDLSRAVLMARFRGC